MRGDIFMQKMAGKVGVILVLSILISLMMMSYAFAATHTLEEVADKFNNCKSVESLKEYEHYYIASVDENNPNTLLITITTEEGKSEFSFVLEDGILSNDTLSGSQLYATIMLIDAVGQVNGYEDGELFYTVNSEVIHDYTIENEGFELKENGDYISIKMDIDKKIPLVDLTDYYIKPDEFSFVKEIVESNDVGNQTGKNLKMSYDVIIRDEEDYIYIGEEKETTKSTYNSVLSAIEVIYGNKVVEYFKSIYPEFIKGTTTLDGFKIETDVDTDEAIFNDSKVVLVTIDNKYVKEELLKEASGDTPKDFIWTNVDDWAKEELDEAEKKELIPETFVSMDATSAITRKDFAAIAVKLYEALTGKEAYPNYVMTSKKDANPKPYNPFTDTDDEYVLKAYALEITLGTSETTFTPNAEITREQMATMLTRALRISGINTQYDITNATRFADDSDLSDWGRPSVYFMAGWDIIKGIGDNKFNGLGNAKIEEAIAISLRSVEVFENSNAQKDIPKSEQTGTAGSNIPLKDNHDEAEYQIKVAMQNLLEKTYGDEVYDARIYVEKIYTAEEEQQDEALKTYDLGPNEVAFEVKYELKLVDGVEDIMKYTAATGEYDEESGWVKEKYNLGVLRPNPDGEPEYIITDFGTGW